MDLSAADVMWAFRRGDVLARGVALPRQNFVIDGRAGRLFMPLPRTLLEPGDLTLCVPEDDDRGLQVLCETAPADEGADGRWFDRWMAYHGPPSGVMAVLTVVSCKHAGRVGEAGDLELANPLAEAESRLVRALNADRAALGRAAAASLLVEVHEPLAVGVDPRGIDIRTRIGVLRVVRTIPASEDAAASDLRAWLG